LNNNLNTETLQKTLFDHRAFWFRKDNIRIKQLQESWYLDVKKLAILRLYLWNSQDKAWRSWNITVTPIFNEIANKEVCNILKSGISRKDLSIILDKAHNLYFHADSLQYSFDFSDDFQHERALNYLNMTLMHIFDYSIWDIRWYILWDHVILWMLEIVSNCWFKEHYRAFQDFIRDNMDTDSHIKSASLYLFYEKIIRKIEQKSKKQNISAIEFQVKKKVVSSING